MPIPIQANFCWLERLLGCTSLYEQCHIPYVSWHMHMFSLCVVLLWLYKLQTYVWYIHEYYGTNSMASLAPEKSPEVLLTYMGKMNQHQTQQITTKREPCIFIGVFCRKGFLLTINKIFPDFDSIMMPMMFCQFNFPIADQILQSLATIIEQSHILPAFNAVVRI